MGTVRTTRSLGKALRRLDEVLFPPIEPHRTGFLEEELQVQEEEELQEEHELTSSINTPLEEEGAPLNSRKEGGALEAAPVPPHHRVFYEVCGNPAAGARCVVFVHGGPGGGCDPKYRQFFDPEHWKIVLFDQRGCGRSTPHAGLERNTTWDLVADMERLRAEVAGVEAWTVFGGSWGSTLALAYAESHPERVEALVLRGIFMLRRAELLWFYQEGASHLFPDAFEKYLEAIPAVERGDLMSAYYRRLTDGDEDVRLAAAKAWSVWEATTSLLYPSQKKIDDAAGDRFAEAFARIECHYFVHGGFFEVEDQLLRDAHRIAHIPCEIVQGRYDVVCPARSAWDLHKALPNATLTIVEDAGHSAFEPGIAAELVRATNALIGK